MLFISLNPGKLTQKLSTLKLILLRTHGSLNIEKSNLIMVDIGSTNKQIYAVGSSVGRANCKKQFMLVDLTASLKIGNNCVIGSSPIQPPMCCVAQWQSVFYAIMFVIRTAIFEKSVCNTGDLSSNLGAAP